MTFVNLYIPDSVEKFRKNYFLEAQLRFFIFFKWFYANKTTENQISTSHFYGLNICIIDSYRQINHLVKYDIADTVSKDVLI